MVDTMSLDNFSTSYAQDRLGASQLEAISSHEDRTWESMPGIVGCQSSSYSNKCFTSSNKNATRGSWPRY